ncbi:MAG TPA: MARCKS-like protein [Paraburkholderia sp.]
MNQPSQHSRGIEGNGSDAGPTIEPQPVPGHTENLPTGAEKATAPKPGVEGSAPDAAPDTKPGTPPGTQSERDRQRADND